MNNYEESQYNAFATLITHSVEYMKSNGATDPEIKTLIDDSILDIINIIQDRERFPNHVYTIIKETSKKKTISDGRQVGMMCELLDRIEDSIRDKVYELLGYNNVVNLFEEKLQKEYGIQMNNVLDILSQMQHNGVLDLKNPQLDN